MQVEDFCIPFRPYADDSIGFRCALSGKEFVSLGSTGKADRAQVLQACRAWVIGILEEQAAFLPSNANVSQRVRLFKALNGTETPAPEYV
jgi:hypothetical protein